MCRHIHANFDYGPGPGGVLGEVPGSLGVRPPRALDELTPIAHWMVQEMRCNVGGESAQRILKLNSYSLGTCLTQTREWSWWQRMIGTTHLPAVCTNKMISTKAAAFLAWAYLVRQNGPWDHKPIIARLFTPAVDTGEQHYHRYHDYVYFYDVWSNIHYGYVGRACGFSESELLGGAGLEQVGSDLLRGERPKFRDGTGWLRRFDSMEDRVAVELGISLHDGYMVGLNAHALVLSIVSKGHLLGRKDFSI